jgi:hypothetical protein
MKKLLLIALIAPSLWGMQPSKKRKRKEITESSARLTSFQEFTKANEKISPQYQSTKRPGRISSEGIAYLSSNYFPAEMDHKIAQDYFDALDIDPLIFDVNNDILSPTKVRLHAHSKFKLRRNTDGESIHLSCNMFPRCKIQKDIYSCYGFYKDPSLNRYPLRNPRALNLAWNKVEKQFNDTSYLIKTNNELITTHDDMKERTWSLAPLYTLREKVKRKLSLHLAMLLYHTKVQNQIIDPALQTDKEYLDKILRETAAEFKAETIAFEEASTQPLN